MKLGMSCHDRLSIQLLSHARRELNIEALNREFAGEKPGKKKVSYDNELFVLLFEVIFHLELRINYLNEFLDERAKWQKELVGVSLVAIESRNSRIIVDEVHRL